MHFGCSLNFVKLDIIGCADDFAILGDSYENFETLIIQFEEDINKLTLVISRA